MESNESESPSKVPVFTGAPGVEPAASAEAPGAGVSFTSVAKMKLLAHRSRNLLKRDVAERAAYVIDDEEEAPGPAAPASDSDDEAAAAAGASAAEEGGPPLQAGSNQFARRQGRARLARQEPPQGAPATPSSASLVVAEPAAEEAAPPAPKAGWVEKATRSWLVPWKWRWLVLEDKQLRWYEDEQATRCLGLLDFDLIAVEVVRFGEGASEPEPAARTRGSSGCCSGRKACTGADLRLLFASNPYGTSFLIAPVGAKRAFEMRLPTKGDANAWVEALLDHLLLATQPKLSVHYLSTFQDDWWRIKRIPPEKFEELADTGDVLLFRTPGTIPKLIRAASVGGRFDHVALILKLGGGQLALLESTGCEGVGMVKWKEFVRNDWQDLYPELALRRVRFRRTGAQLAALQTWVKQVMGKPYSLTVDKLMRRRSVTAEGVQEDDFFCSELVADALKVLGVIPRGKSSTQFWPSTFSAQSAPLEVEPGATFATEDLTIDFSLGDVAGRKAQVKPGAQRDATTNW